MENIKLECGILRRYDGGMPPYLLSIYTYRAFATGDTYWLTQSRAVMDDFGYLRPVGGWR